MLFPGAVQDKIAPGKPRKNRRGKDRDTGGTGFQAPDIRNKPAFLLLAIAVMAILGGMFAVKTRPDRATESKRRTREQIAQDEINILRTGLEFFKIDSGRYPSTGEGLFALIRKPRGIPASRWNGPYVNMVKRDPWRKDYVMVISNGLARVFSSGPDGITGTPDDLQSEEPDLRQIEAYIMDASQTGKQP